MGLCHFRNMESDTLGIAPRLIQDLFKSLESKKYKIHVSFVELYNEQVRDLFTTSQTMSSQDLVIREDKDGHIKIQGTTVHPCKTVDDVLYLLEKGALSRTVGGTQMNHASSRSHAIFTLTLVQTVPIKEGIGFQKLVSKLNLVDLAGSERQKRTCAEGLRFKESIKINSGLLALGNVINSLSQKEMHVPYRDSKLTRILQDSLGGNSVTLLIACVCPLEQSKQETLNTLIYASRARSIENRPILNRSSTLLLNDPPSTVYHDLVEEVHQYLRDPSPTSKKKLIQLLNQIPL
ncbi:Chromosome-associated kinesin kif4a, partial [Coelomomyces lativittatus]